MELRGSPDPSSHSTSGSLGGNDVGATPRISISRFLSIDSFLDSVSTGVAGGTPDLRSRSALHPVEPLDLVAEEDVVISGMPVPVQLFPPEPEPEPELEPGIRGPPVPPLPPRSQSRAAALAQARPPSGSVLSSSDGSDDSGNRPEPGGAMFDVTLEVCRARSCSKIAHANAPNLVLNQGDNIGLTVGAMGIQLFRHKRIITS